MDCSNHQEAGIFVLMRLYNNMYSLFKNEYEPCVYKKVSGIIISFLVLYVDDILVICNDVPTLQDIMTWLGKCFSIWKT
jgi:hypothetical protein